MKLAPKKPAPDPWAALFREALSRPEKRPISDGWKTIPELQADRKKAGVPYGENMTRRWIISLGDRVEKFEGSVRVPEQKRAVRRTWYRPKP